VVVLRAYAEDDLEAVLDVWYEASVVAHSFLPDEFFEAERDNIATLWLPASETIVSTIAGSVEGFLSLNGNEVGGIFVHPDAQSRGVGRALMDDARTRRPFLELSVFEANTQARRFYEAYGFRVVGREVDDQLGHPELRPRLDGAAS
jgi:putative acetyltransferase